MSSRSVSILRCRSVASVASYRLWVCLPRLVVPVHAGGDYCRVHKGTLWRASAMVDDVPGVSGGDALNDGIHDDMLPRRARPQR